MYGPYRAAMSPEQCAEEATSLFNGGYNCAESVFLAVTRAGGQDLAELAGLATMLGGGMGDSELEACGIFGGGLLAVGAFHGRVRPGSDWSAAKELARVYRERFVAACGAVRCHEVLAGFGPQRNLHRCKAMAGTMAGELARLLERRAGQPG